jgi:hypothetical protein
MCWSCDDRKRACARYIGRACTYTRTIHTYAVCVRQYAVPCVTGSCAHACACMHAACTYTYNCIHYMYAYVYTSTVQVYPRYGTGVYGIDACVVLCNDCVVIEVDRCRAT